MAIKIFVDPIKGLYQKTGGPGEAPGLVFSEGMELVLESIAYNPENPGNWTA